MKKFIALLITAATLISLCSCFGDSGAETEPEANTDSSQIEDNSSDSEESSEKASNTEPKSESEATTEDETDTNTEEDFDSMLKDAIIIKCGYEYAFIGGKRVHAFNDSATPFKSDDTVYCPTAFLSEHGSAVNDSKAIEKDGVKYTDVQSLTISGKHVRITEDPYFTGTGGRGYMVIITDKNLGYFDEVSKRDLFRRANNLLAIGSQFSAKSNGDRPVLFVTDEMLAEAKAKAEAKEEPWYSAWLGIKARADAALNQGANPDKGASATAYRLAACKDFINARYLALAYIYTDEYKYLDGAVTILMEYAKNQLGTDKYLDYSAPKGDGQADIGLNIAAPLTAACDVYSLIYPYMEDSEISAFQKWVRIEAKLCKKGHAFWVENDYYDKQYGNNHLTSHLMGMIAAAYVLEDNSLIEYALSSENNEADLLEMLTRSILMEGDEVYSVDPDSNYDVGEIYDRYRSVQNNGFGYSMYHLKFLTHSALMLYHNGIDVFSYYGDNFENLQIPFRTYSEYLIENDITLGSGHYSADKSLNRENAYSTYSIAYYVYKDEKAKQVIEAMISDGISCNEVEMMGVTAPYLFGFSE